MYAYFLPGKHPASLLEVVLLVKGIEFLETSSKKDYFLYCKKVK
jgi:hypothetical protein